MRRLLVTCPRTFMPLTRLRAGCCGKSMWIGIGRRESRALRDFMPAGSMYRWHHWRKPAVLQRITSAVHFEAASSPSMLLMGNRSGRRTPFRNNRKSPEKTKKAFGSGAHRGPVSGQHQLLMPITKLFMSRPGTTIPLRPQGRVTPLWLSTWNPAECCGFGN